MAVYFKIGLYGISNEKEMNVIHKGLPSDINDVPNILKSIRRELVSGGEYTSDMDEELFGGDIEAGHPAKVEIETVRQEIKTNDVLMPINVGQSYSAQFNMTRPTEVIDGSIISSDNQMREFGSTAIVLLNRGRDDNLKEGHILDINKKSPTVIEGKHGPRYVEDATKLEKFITGFREMFGTENDEDSVVWTMPKEKVGELMVFKVYDNISYAMVTRSQQPIRVGDTISAN